MMYSKWQLLFLTIVSCSVVSTAQVSFDHYIPLQSKGAVPTDFSKATRQKISEDAQHTIPGLSRSEQKVFIEQVNYTIDELLKSGLITYGDEVTTYIQRIGDRLTESDAELKGKLRFYTLNSNEANAFSTNQGMVFVTTGLIAQMTNEAQLAFVLAHEIIHYRERHVLDLYDYASDNKSLSYDEKVRFFTKYSRDNEFEADKEGVKLYHAAGYASSEILKTFDVLIIRICRSKKLRSIPRISILLTCSFPKSCLKSRKQRSPQSRNTTTGSRRIRTLPNASKRCKQRSRSSKTGTACSIIPNNPLRKSGRFVASNRC